MRRVLKRSQSLAHGVVPHNQEGGSNQQRSGQANTQANQCVLLISFDRGEHRGATMRTSPRAVADLPVTFMTLDEGHNLRVIQGFEERRKFRAACQSQCPFSRPCGTLAMPNSTGR